jgi:hypothetical protein
MTLAAPPRYVAAPVATPYRYGLLSSADVLEDPPGRWQLGIEYEPVACGGAAALPPGCDMTAMAVDTGVPLVSGGPLLIYAGFSCSPVGHLDDAQDRAEAALIMGEQRALERAYWTGSEGNRPRLADLACTTLNAVTGTAGAVSLRAGIAMLEDTLGDEYGGIGVIHAPRGVAVNAATLQLLRPAGFGLVTPLGTRWAFGGGYAVNTGPDGAPAAAGTAWLYATGGVTVRRGPPVFYGGPETLDRAENTLTVYAERLYVITHDCLCAAVLVCFD